jgi:hypothetical protein
MMEEYKVECKIGSSYTSGDTESDGEITISLKNVTAHEFANVLGGVQRWMKDQDFSEELPGPIQAPAAAPAVKRGAVVRDNDARHLGKKDRPPMPGSMREKWKIPFCSGTQKKEYGNAVNLCKRHGGVTYAEALRLEEEKKKGAVKKELDKDLTEAVTATAPDKKPVPKVKPQIKGAHGIRDALPDTRPPTTTEKKNVERAEVPADPDQERMFAPGTQVRQIGGRVQLHGVGKIKSLTKYAEAVVDIGNGVETIKLSNLAPVP